MGTVRRKMTLINDGFGAAMLDVATRGQSLIDNTGIKAPLSIIVIALFKCSYVIFLCLYLLLCHVTNMISINYFFFK